MDDITDHVLDNQMLLHADDGTKHLDDMPIAITKFIALYSKRNGINTAIVLWILCS